MPFFRPFVFIYIMGLACIFKSPFSRNPVGQGMVNTLY